MLGIAKVVGSVIHLRFILLNDEISDCYLLRLLGYVRHFSERSGLEFSPKGVGGCDELPDLWSSNF